MELVIIGIVMAVLGTLAVNYASKKKKPDAKPH